MLAISRIEATLWVTTSRASFSMRVSAKRDRAPVSARDGAGAGTEAGLGASPAPKRRPSGPVFAGWRTGAAATGRGAAGTGWAWKLITVTASIPAR
ncbi:hypothetical protein D3C87_1497420 [compost metagenome]